ncbi:MAG: cell division protein CrgA [Actinomycetota bacterium]|nr:cell division protein CrgA [Actinomycetota bacterium]
MAPQRRRAPAGRTGRRRNGRGSPSRGRVTPPPSGRYTPPIPKSEKSSPRWLVVVMLTLLLLGMLVIVCNYLGLLPGEASNGYLFLGLGFITAGFLVATRYR